MSVVYLLVDWYNAELWLENENVTNLEISSVKTLVLKCGNLRVLGQHAVTELLHEDSFNNLEFLKLYNLKADSGMLDNILQDCPKLKEIIYISPEEILSDHVWPESLKALSISAREFSVDLDLASIENVQLMKVFAITADTWSTGVVHHRTGQFLTEDRVHVPEKFLLL